MRQTRQARTTAVTQVSPNESTVDNESQPILQVEHLSKNFRVRGPLGHKRVLRAVNDVSFAIQPGETLGWVGKSTLGRTILGIYRADRGAVQLQGEDIVGLTRRKMRRHRRQMQVVFQDPYSSLDPRMTVGEVIAEPLRINGKFRPSRVSELMELVGLAPEMASRRPADFSGGQRQRIGIARALALEPKVLILDEPVSALDVSIQAQVINLLKRLQQELGLTYLFIAHDLAVVRHISNRVAVMYLGKIVEIGTRDQIFGSPTHPYTRALLAAVPVPDPYERDKRQYTPLAGELPDPADPPSGCVFRTRCPIAQEICATSEPLLIERVDEGRLSACHFAADVGALT
jgi:oligopeptide/dipeptide ABC transporter ATP-binding protein